jgi:hypothetical protein
MLSVSFGKEEQGYQLRAQAWKILECPLVVERFRQGFLNLQKVRGITTLNVQEPSCA